MIPATINYPLWKHLHDEHGLTLLESELDEIIRHAMRPCEELKDAIPIVLYFKTNADADEFSKLVQEAQPNLKLRKP